MANWLLQQLWSDYCFCKRLGVTQQIPGCVCPGPPRTRPFSQLRSRCFGTVGRMSTPIAFLSIAGILWAWVSHPPIFLTCVSSMAPLAQLVSTLKSRNLSPDYEMVGMVMNLSATTLTVGIPVWRAKRSHQKRPNSRITGMLRKILYILYIKTNVINFRLLIHLKHIEYVKYMS